MVAPEDSQLFLIYYLQWICRQRFARFTIGRPAGLRRKMDDVSVELFRDGKRYLYLFNVNDRQYIKQRLSYGALIDLASEFSLVRYFAEYLRLKEKLELVDHEIAVWTTAAFRKRDRKLFEMFELLESGAEMPDLVENSSLGIKRYRVRSNVLLEELLLIQCHPVNKLAKKIARLLFAKLPIGPHNTSNESFGWLLEHVFENNRFRQTFLLNHSTLPELTQLFRTRLESMLHQQFHRKQVDDFELARIEQPPYSSHIQIRLEKLVTSDSRKCRRNFENIPTVAEVQSFLKVVVFYTNVPEAKAFQKVIHQECNLNRDICSELAGYFRRGVFLDEVQIRAIFELIELRKASLRWRSDDLQFKLESLKGLEEALSRFSASERTRLVFVRAGGSVRLTMARIRVVCEELLSSSRFIFMNDANDSKLDKLFSILSCLRSVMKELPVVVLFRNNGNNILSNIRSATEFCYLVLVSERSEELGINEVIFEDSFSFNDLSDFTKDRLLSKKVKFEGREFLLSSLMSEEIINAIPIEALVDWNLHESINFGAHTSNKNQIDNFIERTVCSELGEKADLLKEDPDCITILSGEPGIGKSVLLQKMVDVVKHEQCVSILRNCRSLINLFNNTLDVLEILFKMLNIEEANHFQTFFIKMLVKEKKIHLFLDGFDEVSEMTEQASKSFFKWIQNIGFHSVIVTTRPHLKSFLKQALDKSVVYYLKPLDESDLLNFLKHRWESVGGDEKQLDYVVQNIQTPFEDGFLQIPLQLMITAMIFEEHRFQIQNARKSFPNTVEEFIERKFTLYTSEFFNSSSRAHEIALKSLRSSFEVEHAELAFKIECGLKAEHEMFRKLDQYGLLRIKNDDVRFVDTAFQEYFLTKYLVMHHVEQKYFSQLFLKIFDDLAGCRLADFLDYHIAHVDNKRKLIGLPNVLENAQTIPLRAGHKLNEHQVKQLYICFQIECSERQLIKKIRSSITSNKLSIFEAIYDSLPTELYKSVIFKFYSNGTNQNAVDLSTLPEQSIVSLLKILFKKHPENLVQRVVANFPTNETDFITRSIEQGYTQLIEHLFCINQSLTAAGEVELLQDYIEQRWREYLEQIVVLNRIEIAEIIKSCIAKKYHQRTIKAFLMEQNFLHALAGVCQKVDESVLEIVELIVGFAEDYLSEYDLGVLVERTFDGTNLKKLVECIPNKQIRSVFEKLCRSQV